MTRAAALLAALLAGLGWILVAGVPSAAQGTGAQREAVIPAEVVDGIEALLEVRVDEVSRGSGTDSLHPDADASLRERWNRTTAGYAEVGLDLYTEELPEPLLDLTPPQLSDASPRIYAIEVRRSWQVAGVDEHPAVESIFLAVQEHLGEWKVLDDDPLRAVGLTSTRALWEITDIDVVRSGARVLVGAPSETARMNEVSRLLDRAHTNLTAIAPPDNYLVLVPNGADQTKEYLQTPLDVSKFVAFVSFAIDREDDWVAGPPRLVLQEGNLRRRSAARQVFILAHELVHVDALADAGPITPVWVHEGYADWEANGRRASASGELPFPESFTFRSGSVSEIVAAYDRSEALFARIAELAGAEATRGFFDAVGSVRSEPGTVSYHLGRALGVVGLDRATLEGLESTVEN